MSFVQGMLAFFAFVAGLGVLMFLATAAFAYMPSVHSCWRCGRRWWTNRDDERYCSKTCRDLGMRTQKGYRGQQRGEP